MNFFIAIIIKMIIFELAYKNYPMISLTSEQIDLLLQNTAIKETCSDFGFFSKPFRVKQGADEFIVKTFLPVKNKKLVEQIIDNHKGYVDALRAIGILLPDTYISSIQQNNKHQIVIIQQPFKDEELVRNIMLHTDLSEILQLCTLLFNETVKFCYHDNKPLEIGFHPTLRNYAYHDSTLHYFDTFPPMLMSQRKLNQIIIAMSPYGRLIKKIIPQQFINRVSNEYYFTDKMFIGIVGSTCRLRPEFAAEVLEFSKDFVKHSDKIPQEDKEAILQLLNKPPSLSKLWVTVRKIFKQPGKPNV